MSCCIRDLSSFFPLSFSMGGIACFFQRKRAKSTNYTAPALSFPPFNQTQMSLCISLCLFVSLSSETKQVKKAAGLSSAPCPPEDDSTCPPTRAKRRSPCLIVGCCGERSVCGTALPGCSRSNHWEQDRLHPPRRAPLYKTSTPTQRRHRVAYLHAYMQLWLTRKYSN